MSTFPVTRDADPLDQASVVVDLVVVRPVSADSRGLEAFVARLGAQGVAVRRHAVLTRDDSPTPDATVALALVDGSVLVSDTPLGALYDDPRLGTAALARRGPGGNEALGLLRVAPRDRRQAVALLDREPGPDPVLDVIRGLEAAGVKVSAVPLGGFVWARVTDGLALEEARAAAGALDERRVRLREAARGGDGFYSTFVLRKLSWRLTSVAERLGVTPNQVTVASFVVGLLAAGAIATGTRPLMVAGALLLQLCLVVDCVDGELARYRRRFSRFGAWLDATTDRVKEFAVIAAFAVAGHAQNSQNLWGLAAAAIALQTFRNLADLGWAAQRGPAEVPPSPWVGAGTRIVTPRRSRGPGALEWVRRVGHFPVGERFLLLSVGALVLSPRVTLVLLLVPGVLAGLYLLAAFAVRFRPGRRVDVGRMVDGGLLLSRLRASGRVGALLPAVIAAVELAVSWALVGGWAGLVVVAVTAIAHYQAAYGDREAQPMSGLAVGTDVRLVVLVVAAVTGAGWLALLLAGVVAVTSTVRSLSAWTVAA